MKIEGENATRRVSSNSLSQLACSMCVCRKGNSGGSEWREKSEGLGEDRDQLVKCDSDDVVVVVVVIVAGTHVIRAKF